MTNETQTTNGAAPMQAVETTGSRAASALLMYFHKRGDISGPFKHADISQIIDAAIAKDTKRIVQRLNKASTTNRKLGQRVTGKASAYADGSAFAFFRAARIVLGLA